MEDEDLKLTYAKMNRKVEKWIGLLFMALNLSIIPLTMTMLFYLLFIHFTRGLELDDYRLPFPMW